MDAIQTTATEWTKPILQEKDIRNRIKASCMQWWIRPIDITSDLLRSKGVFNIDQVMNVVRKLICEFYGIWLWELASNNKDFLMSKYNIPENHFRTLCEWNIMLAYQEFAKANNWDDREDRETPPPPLPTTTNVIDLPEKLVEQEEYRMLLAAKQNLTQMMEWEKDKEKLELYEAQMKVLDLKIKNAEPWKKAIQPNE